MNFQPAPDFTLEHVEGHPVSLHDYRGRSVVIAFSGRNSAEQMIEGIKGLRGTYDHDQLPVLAVAQLDNIPRPARMLAKRQLKSGYKEAVDTAVADLQAAGKPIPPSEQLVVMLPDWEGSVAASFGIEGIEDDYAMVLVDAEGNIRGYGRGPQAPEQILGLFA